MPATPPHTHTDALMFAGEIPLITGAVSAPEDKNE